jgi:hypothetical protein
VARGNKDVYFIKDDKDSKNLFDNRYNPTPPQIAELRRLPPLNQPGFGRSFEFQVEIAGDVFVEPTLLIDLPSWLPPPQALLNPTSVITDGSGVSYGYTNGIGFFLFEKIQFYQDRILLQEWSGDGLFAITRSRGSMNSAFLENALTGVHDGTAVSLGKNTTPGLLRLSLPLIGCQDLNDGGFPRVAAIHQNFRIRCILRKLEDLVEASDGRPQPVPWGTGNGGKTFQIKTSATAVPTQFTTLERLAMGPPNIEIETRHIYVDGDTQNGLRKETITTLYERSYENHFTQGPLDYAPLRRGGVAQVPRILDADHPGGRVVLGFRSATALLANQRWKYTVGETTDETDTFYNQFSLILAGRDREIFWTPLVWRYLEQHAKEERDSGYNLSFMNWTLGDIRGRIAPFPRQLEGTLNWTSAIRPTLLIDLKDIVLQNSFLDVYIQGWAALEFEDGRASMLFGN